MAALVQIMASCWTGDKPFSEPGNVGMFYWCIYTSLGLSKLSLFGHATLKSSSNWLQSLSNCLQIWPKKNTLFFSPAILKVEIAAISRFGKMSEDRALFSTYTTVLGHSTGSYSHCLVIPQVSTKNTKFDNSIHWTSVCFAWTCSINPISRYPPWSLPHFHIHSTFARVATQEK